MMSPDEVESAGPDAPAGGGDKDQASPVPELWGYEYIDFYGNPSTTGFCYASLDKAQENAAILHHSRKDAVSRFVSNTGRQHHVDRIVLDAFYNMNK